MKNVYNADVFCIQKNKKTNMDYTKIIFLDTKNRSDLMYRKMCSIDGCFALRHMDYDEQKEEYCLIACNQNPRAFVYVLIECSEDFLKKMCKLDGELALECMPSENQTEELCTIAVTQNPFAIRHVGPKFLSFGLSMIACSLNGNVIQYVPDEYKNDRLCIIAIKQNSSAIEYIEEKTNEMFIIANKK